MTVTFATLLVHDGECHSNFHISDLGAIAVFYTNALPVFSYKAFV